MKILEQEVRIPEYNISDQQAVTVIAEAAEHCFRKPFNEAVELLKQLKRKKHMSPFEHANVSMLIRTDVATYKQLTRHRHCAFTIESTHYIDYDGLEIIRPGILRNMQAEVYAQYVDDVESAFLQIEAAYQKIHAKYGKLVSRNLLPQAQSAELTMTTNWRELYQIFDLRKGNNNTPNTVLLMREMMNKLEEKYPMMMSFYYYDGHESSWGCGSL